MSKKSKNFAELVDTVSQLDRKTYRELWRITRQYRKADKMLNRAMDRQEREGLLPKKSGNSYSTAGLEYEIA